MGDRYDLPLDKNSNFYQDVKLGVVPGYSLTEKFGFGILTTSLKPITISGEYRTPIALTSLEVISDSADDSASGLGIQTLHVEGIGVDWARIEDTITMDGLTASPFNKDFYRVDRFHGETAGTYATTAGSSHDSNITIRESGGGQTWAKIDTADTNFGKGQSQIACATIEKGKVTFIVSKHIFIESNKTANVFFFQRDDADDITTPYSGVMRLVEQELGASGQLRTVPKGSFGGFIGACDIGFMGKVSSGTANVSIDFEILLVDENLVREFKR